MVTQHLNIHQQSVHPAPAAAPQAATTNTAPSKTAKKERPAITNQMTEEQWRFYLDEWGRYKRQTGIKAQELLDELWSCMAEELRQLAFAEGGTVNLTTEDLMMKKIKSLAVVSLHSSIHVVNLHETRQQSDENVHSFAARVKGISASCGLQKKCSSCQQICNYAEETAYHVVMAGLCDQNMKEKALTQAMLETITDLDSLVKFCTAEESGRLGVPATLAPLRKSTYKLQHRIKPCSHCGQKRHGDGSQQTREKECKAFGKTCTKCGRKNHFSTVCKSSPPSGGNNAISSESTYDDSATHNAMHFMAMSISKDTREKSSSTMEVQNSSCKVQPTITYSVATSNRFSVLHNEQSVQDHHDKDLPVDDRLSCPSTEDVDRLSCPSTEDVDRLSCSSTQNERPSVKEAEEDAGDTDSDDENRKKFEEEDGNEYDSVNGESETESEIKTKRRSRHNLSQSDSESEKMIDSSNDEPEAGNGDDEEDKGTEEKSVEVVEGEDEEEIDKEKVEGEEEFYLDSDEDFDEQFEVEKVIVRNWYDAPETIIDYTKVPNDLSKHGSTFKATPTSLNNQLVFVATNNHVGRHNPFDKSRKSFCGLSPVCKLSWEPDREITQVLITECDNHPRLGRPVWSCRHHAVASMKGVKLQTQRYNYRNKEVEETLDLEADKDVKEMSEGLGTVDETIDEEIEVGGLLWKRRSQVMRIS